MALKHHAIPGAEPPPPKEKRPRKRYKPRAPKMLPIVAEPEPVVDLAKLQKQIKAVATAQSIRRIDFFRPYPKQLAFYALSATMQESAMIAANQVGKSECGGVAASFHMTGQYPDWWPGRRFTKPTRGWIAGETSLLVRDVQQKKLCGQPGVDSDFGRGMIPKAAFVDKPSLARGVTDAFDTIQVRHVSGGISTAAFKSYEQGRAKFQGEPVDWIWPDEEPPEEIYAEMLPRITATRGIIFSTFTPMLGMSSVVLRYMNEESTDRGFVNMTIDEAEHIPAEERQKIIDRYLPHEREARARGVPVLGSGRIFQTPQGSLREPLIERLPEQWFKGWGIDFGIGHPFAAVLCAWDKDMDVFHVLHGLRVTDQKPIQHAAAMKLAGVNAPVAWPQDGTQREKGSGEVLASHYKREGLRMMPDHATHPDGGLSTEAAILEMDKWMGEGRFKVADHLTPWFEEYDLYHRKDGLIVKLRDDLMSATRVAFMMRRFFRQVALGGELSKRRRQTVAEGIDFALF